MSTMTFAFHPFHNPYNFTNTHSLPQNPPSITTPTSLPEPVFPVNYDSWSLEPRLSPAQYGSAGFHHGDESHCQPHLGPPENPRLSPSTILRHDTYKSVLGNAFNPVAPTGLAPQAPISLDVPCLELSSSPPVQTDPLAQSALPSDPLQSVSPPWRPACSNRVSKQKRKRTRSVSREEEDPDPHITSRLQAANHGLHSSTTTATPKSPREMRGFVGNGKGGSSSGMVAPPVPSLQPGDHQRSFPTLSGVQKQHQQPQPGYPTVPVGSMDGRHQNRRRMDDGQGPSGLSVAQQQQQEEVAGYPYQQCQSLDQAHRYGIGAQPTKASLSQPPQPPYGYSSTSAGPGYIQHAHPAHAPTRNPSMYAAPISTTPLPWTGGSSTQGQEQSYYSGPTAYSQPTQAYQQPSYTSPTHSTGTYQVHTPARSSSSGSGSIVRPTPLMMPGPIPPSVTGTRPLSPSAWSQGAAAGSSAAVSAAGSQVPPRRGSGGHPMGTGLAAPVMMDSVIGVSGEDHFEYGPSEFPPKPYPGGEKAKLPWWPTRKTEKLYGSRLDQTDPFTPTSQLALPPDPLQSISPPGHPACSKRVSKKKRKRTRSMSRKAEDPNPHITPQLQAANHGLHSSTTTTTTPKSPREMRGFVGNGRGGSLSGMAAPPVPSLQPGDHQRSSPTSSGIHHHHYHHHQQPQPGYPTAPLGSMDERYPNHRRVDDGQGPSGLSVAQKQQQIAGYPAQQYQSPARAHWSGSGAQPINAPLSQPPQSPYGYSSTSAGPGYSQHAHPAHPPTRNPSMYAAPFSTPPSQWTSGSSTQGQEHYPYHAEPVAYPQLMEMPLYQQPPYISPTPATLAGTFSLADNPSFDVPPHLAQADLTASSETPNSEAVPGGSNTSVGGMPASLNQRVGPVRSNINNSRQAPKPYQRKTRPITYEGNLVRLQQRCWRQGADNGAIGLLGKVFTNEVSLEALTRPLTDGEAETKEFGVETGRIYIAFLEAVDKKGVGTRYVCRLCHSGRNWKQHKDALRHLRRDHFGLADVCNQCDKKCYTKGEMTSHRCKVV